MILGTGSEDLDGSVDSMRGNGEAGERRGEALRILALENPAVKAAAARALGDAGTRFTLDPATELHATQPLPGRPARPRLVDPARVPRRTPFTPEGRAALLHAVAHIEFNAIKTVLSVGMIGSHEDCLLLRPVQLQAPGKG